ncbi:hypothetical protein CR513_44988, partial [Mucuna pruriens]
MQSFNAKVEPFSKGKRKSNGVSMHKSKGSHNDNPNNSSNRSHRSHRSETNERPIREMRHEEEEHRKERRYEEDPRRARRYEKTSLDVLKCKIPPFIGDGDVESYLKLEMKVDQILECFNNDDYDGYYEFSGYALVWWNQYIREVRDGRRRHIYTWLDLRKELRTRFEPASYAWDLYNKMKRMYQGAKGIEEYFKETKSNEATMAWFLHGLNKEI